MCLGVHGRIVETLSGYGGQLALVDVEGVERKVNVGMLADSTLAPGDWVLIHLGFAIERVDAAGALHAMEGLDLMASPRGEDPRGPR